MRRFFNGVFIGSLLGALVGLLTNGKMKPQRKKLLGKTKSITNNASKMWGSVTKEVRKMMKK
ncbi:MAG: hypothetical protein GXY91_09975 [Clostridia bacterium]|nr:hypothetical protein [Clostridia bacterium]